MGVIYKPGGAAGEYAKYALNVCKGCTFGCVYCYAPGVMRKTSLDFHSNPDIKNNIVDRFKIEAEKMRGLNDEFMLNFIGDPYMNSEVSEITREILEICAFYQFENVSILTKAGHNAVRDFGIMKDNGWKFGQSISFWDDKIRKEYEPNASSIQSRYAALKMASCIGLYTWISLEPIVIPEQAYEVIKNTRDCVDYWKIGKLNHMTLKTNVDWHEVVCELEKLLNGKNYLIKNSLIKYKL